MRTSVDAAAIQISSALVDPARFHVAVGKVYTLEHRSGLYECVIVIVWTNEAFAGRYSVWLDAQQTVSCCLLAALSLQSESS